MLHRRAAKLHAARRVTQILKDVHETGLDRDCSNARHCAQRAIFGSGVLLLIEYNSAGPGRLSVTEWQSRGAFGQTERHWRRRYWLSMAQTSGGLWLIRRDPHISGARIDRAGRPPAC